VIGFRVSLNGEHVTTVGLSGQHVTSIFVDSRLQDRGDHQSDAPSLRLSLGGSGLQRQPDGSGKHFTWLVGHPLTVGDRITVEVVDVSEVSEPLKEAAAIEVSESKERERLSYLLKKYG